ncbi:MAG TPA: hypothetical protein PLB67_16455 [Candidatus Hydrogenedentes bacterium]|nr:hypothetical protein [FCB group bacterium]HNZ20377.1 hypothetical protein [Candidatus Hydrogenedentota bacterium]HPA06024.1 hypothetical protein [Candidatus Hydrogenedentota bacterium]HQH69599.1 hypothetical protein [Candidatus Hydrogenedentota bacterium]
MTTGNFAPRALMLIVLFAVVSPVPAHAFLYRAPEGSLKDNCVIWHDGSFHLFTMYRKTQQLHDVIDDWRYVWHATSQDGVHWKDGSAVIHDAPFPIWAMRVWRAGGRFVMNHGSFTGGQQDVLRFWESPDLVHWTCLGPDYDVRRPDGQRLDHMDVIAREENGTTVYYGYAAGGLLQSDDGVRWTWVKDYPLTDDLDVRVVMEPGGCERIGNTYYLLVGGFFPGSFGYAVATYVSEDPLGPFRPDYPALRLNGHSGRTTVALWAAYCRYYNELLLTNYIHDPGGTFWWHAPLKKPVLDGQGHLHMGYWEGNDALKGAPIVVDASRVAAVNPGVLEVFVCEPDRVIMKAPPRPPLRWLTADQPNRAIALLPETFDVERGVVVEGDVCVSPAINATIFPATGLYLEEEAGKGKAVLFETWNQTEIGTLDLTGEPRFEAEDQTGAGCATVAGIPCGQTCHFRLFFRKNIFELYLDDLYVQTYVTGQATGRIGFVAQDGEVRFERLQAWQMNL